MKSKHMDDDTILKVFQDVMGAVCFLHSQNIFHRDIKPENILLDGKGSFKLCDFGFSALFGNGENRQTLCGTKEYLAPEVIASEYQDDKVDIWCMGVLLYELVHKRPPFTGRNIIQMYQEFKNKKFTFRENIPLDFKKIIELCLKFEPSKRPTAQFLFENFSFLREKQESSRYMSNTLKDVFLRDNLKTSEKQGNVNINIGSVNINIVNNQGSHYNFGKKTDPSKSYVNVYSNIPSSQNSTRVIQNDPKNGKTYKFSIPNLKKEEPQNQQNFEQKKRKTVKEESIKPSFTYKLPSLKMVHSNTSYVNYTSANPSPQFIKQYSLGLKQNSISLTREQASQNSQTGNKIGFLSLNSNQRSQQNSNEFFFCDSNPQTEKNGQRKEKANSKPTESLNRTQPVQKIGSSPQKTSSPITSFSPAPRQLNLFSFPNNQSAKANRETPFEVPRTHAVDQNLLKTTASPVSHKMIYNNQPNSHFIQTQANQMNWTRSQNMLNSHVQIVNIYKKSENNSHGNTTNIYQNMPNEISTRNNPNQNPLVQIQQKNEELDRFMPQSNSFSGCSDKQTVTQITTYQTIQNQFNPRRSNEMRLTRTISYETSINDRPKIVSSSVPRRIEGFHLPQPVVIRVNEQLRPTSNQARTTPVEVPQAIKIARSNSSQIGEVRSVRYVNFQ